MWLAERNMEQHDARSKRFTLARGRARRYLQLFLEHKGVRAGLVSLRVHVWADERSDARVKGANVPLCRGSAHGAI